jgi:apolipoprotein N-acyltransferase
MDSPTLDYGYPLRLKTFVQTNHVKLITGGYTHQIGTGRITNSFFAIGDNGEWMAPPYHKTVLLAFGEYMPLGEEFPFLRKMFPEVGDFGRGPGPTVMETGGLKIGPLICYESLFDWFVRSLANQGGQIMVNLTNDSWYGKWEQPYQHGYMTLSRAVEVRRPLIRSTNTGLSTVILATGEILDKSPLHEVWSHLYEVPYLTNPPATIFMGWGYYLIPILLIIGFVFIVARGILRANEQS